MPNRIYMKQKFFAFKMDESKPIENGIDEFNRVVLDLEELEVKIDEEDKAVVLLNSLPKSLKNFKDTLKFGRDVLTVDLILKSLNAKLLDIKKGRKDAAQIEALIAKGRVQQRNREAKASGTNNQPKSNFKNTKKHKNLICFHCNKQGHIRKNCPERLNGKQTQGNASLADQNYESVEVLVVTTSSSQQDWVLDYGCIFHMTPNRSWFNSYQTSKGGKVFLGDNSVCHIMGTCSIAFKIYDGVV